MRGFGRSRLKATIDGDMPIVTDIERVLDHAEQLEFKAAFLSIEA
jgi:hypothetical protein